MTTTAVLLVTLATLAVVTLLAGLVRAVRQDGYGHRPPPRSHRTWDEDALTAAAPTAARATTRRRAAEPSPDRRGAVAGPGLPAAPGRRRAPASGRPAAAR